jgi:hypothetical protein
LVSLAMYFFSVKRKKLDFVIPTPASPSTFSNIANIDLEETKAQWPVIPEEQ